ncbi:MAG: hypothetical protein HY905_16840 [Deltaproteobacteria bacterium]|nr:hypothetical protein [Deltaproteobacteria bacterium]
MMRVLGTDLVSDDARPYFVWDEDLSNGEIRELLRSASEPERLRLLAKILREARDEHVWAYTTPEEVARLLPRLLPMLGRRRAFWVYLVEGWRADGLL